MSYAVNRSGSSRPIGGGISCRRRLGPREKERPRALQRRLPGGGLSSGLHPGHGPVWQRCGSPSLVCIFWVATTHRRLPKFPKLPLLAKWSTRFVRNTASTWNYSMKPRPTPWRSHPDALCPDLAAKPWQRWFLFRNRSSKKQI